MSPIDVTDLQPCCRKDLVMREKLERDAWRSEDFFSVRMCVAKIFLDIHQLSRSWPSRTPSFSLAQSSHSSVFSHF